MRKVDFEGKYLLFSSKSDLRYVPFGNNNLYIMFILSMILLLNHHKS